MSSLLGITKSQRKRVESPCQSPIVSRSLGSQDSWSLSTVAYIGDERDEEVGFCPEAESAEGGERKKWNTMKLSSWMIDVFQSVWVAI